MIRFLDEGEVVLQRQVRSEIARDAYWREIAAQRGSEDVAFKWSRSVSNGYVVRGATPVAIPKRAQLAHVGPEREGTVGFHDSAKKTQHGGIQARFRPEYAAGSAHWVLLEPRQPRVSG